MFKRVQLKNQFEPRENGRVYGVDQLVDMAQYPKARSLTMYCLADSNVDRALTVRAVGNDSPDVINGLVAIGPAQSTTPVRESKLAFSIQVSVAPFPFYGLIIDTGADAPNAGRVWAYADVWWEGTE